MHHPAPGFGGDEALSHATEKAPDASLTRWLRRGRLAWMTSDAELTAIAHVAQTLSARFPHITPTVVTQVVRDTYNSYGAHPTREFVPILVEDAAGDRLRVMGPTA